MHQRYSDTRDTNIETRVDEPYTVTWDIPEIDAPSALEAALVAETFLTGLFYRPAFTVTGVDGEVSRIDLDALVHSDGGDRGNPIKTMSGPKPTRRTAPVPELSDDHTDKRSWKHWLVDRCLTDFDDSDGRVPTYMGISSEDIAAAHGGYSYGLETDPQRIGDDASCISADGTVLTAGQLRYLAVHRQLMWDRSDGTYSVYDDMRDYAADYYANEQFPEIFGNRFGGYDDYAADRSVFSLVLLNLGTTDSMDEAVMCGVDLQGRILWVREQDDIA